MRLEREKIKSILIIILKNPRQFGNVGSEIFLYIYIYINYMTQKNYYKISNTMYDVSYKPKSHYHIGYLNSWYISFFLYF